MDAVAMRSDSSVNVTRTETLSTEAAAAVQPPVLRLRLKKPKSDRKVGWSEETVDNENMGRKKSKCCCIYKKPVAFGESSSEDDEDCEHCFGHPEKKRKNRKKRDRDNGGDGQEHSDEDDDENSDGPVCSFKDKPK